MATLRDRLDVDVVHAWGMTEMSPLGTVGTLQARHRGLPHDEQCAILQKQGHALFGVDMKIVDDAGAALPWDGVAAGHLHVRGPWVIAQYFRAEGGTVLQDGWFPTGDVATIDPDGYMQITDRSKDVIKSGGEWIGSIDLENIAMAHPAVLQAACIAVSHPKWDERPLLLVVRRPGAGPDGGCNARFLRRQGRAILASRRRRLHRCAAGGCDRQDSEKQVARAISPLQTADRLTRRTTNNTTVLLSVIVSASPNNHNKEET